MLGPDKYKLYVKQFSRVHLSVYSFPTAYGIGISYYPKRFFFSQRELVVQFGTLHAYLVFGAGRKEFDDAI